MDASQIANVALGLILALTTLGSRLTIEGRRRNRKLRAANTRAEAWEDYGWQCRRLLIQHGVTPPPWGEALAKEMSETDEEE